ncbi:MAG: hypothetical protein ABEJ08_01715 [Halobacteriaceae archaeon]
MTTVDAVYRVHSTIEVPSDSLDEFLEEPPLPDGIEALETTRRGDQLFIEPTPADEAIDRYTPTATLRATLSETRVYEYQGQRHRTEPATPDGETPPSETVLFAGFKGKLGTVLKNSTLQGSMFTVLREIARFSTYGELTAIVERDGKLEAVSVENGEERSASVAVVEKEGAADDDTSMDWQPTQS